MCRKMGSHSSAGTEVSSPTPIGVACPWAKPPDAAIQLERARGHKGGGRACGRTSPQPRLPPTSILPHASIVPTLAINPQADHRRPVQTRSVWLRAPSARLARSNGEQLGKKGGWSGAGREGRMVRGCLACSSLRSGCSCCGVGGQYPCFHSKSARPRTTSALSTSFRFCPAPALHLASSAPEDRAPALHAVHPAPHSPRPPHRSELHARSGSSQVPSSLLTFFIVFYGQQSYTRYYMFYQHCIGMNGAIMEW